MLSKPPRDDAELVRRDAAVSRPPKKRGFAGSYLIFASEFATAVDSSRCPSQRRPADLGEVSAVYQLTLLRRLGNLLITPLERLGLAGERTHTSAVGERLALLDAYAARHSRRRALARGEEVGPEEAAPGLRDYLRATPP